MRTNKKGAPFVSVLRAATCISVLAAAACGDTDPTPTDIERPEPVPTTVTASSSTVSFSALGDTEQLTAVVLDQDGTVHPEWTVRWESSEEAVARVTTSGLVEAVANGSTEIFAASIPGEVSDTVHVTVAQVVVSLSLASDSLVLGGPTDQASVQVAALDGSGSEIAGATTWWSSDDPAVVRVLDGHIFVAEAVGTTALVASATTGQDTVRVSIRVTVDPPPVLSPEASCEDHPFYAVARFEDPALETAVRDALSLSPQENITCALLGRLDGLTATSVGIISLVGLQNARRISWISLKSNSVSDISPLSGLAHVRRLDLQANPVTDLSAAGSLPRLTRLSVQGGKFSDLSPLAGHPSLESLQIAATPVTDIGPLSGISSLQELGLSQTAVTDISAIGTLANLRWLDIGNTDVTDLSPLSGATSLQVLHLRNLSLSDLSPLAPLGDLEFLAISNSAVDDIAAFSGLTSLQTLEAGNNSISDITALSGLIDLTRLGLGLNSIIEIAALEGLTGLQNLALGGNPALSNIAPLLDNEGLGGGDVVTLSQTNVSCSDISALRLKGVEVRADC